MPRKKIFEKGYVTFNVKIPRDTWRLMRGELSHYNWPVIVRVLIEDHVKRLMHVQVIEKTVELNENA